MILRRLALSAALVMGILFLNKPISDVTILDVFFVVVGVYLLEGMLLWLWERN